jgi:hypothetical protein
MDDANGETTEKLARRRKHFVDNSVVAVVVGGIGSLSGYAGSLTDLFLVGAVAVFLINLCSPRLGHAVLR